VPPPPPPLLLLLLLLLLQEFTSWTNAAGFKSTELIHLVGPNSAAVPHKSQARPGPCAL
jgi:hypothetical protein